MIFVVFFVVEKIINLFDFGNKVYDNSIKDRRNIGGYECYFIGMEFVVE